MGFGRSFSAAVGRLIALVVIVIAFFGAMATVVYLGLQGKEVTVPDLAGKSLSETEHELASLGLKVKKRAERVSAQPIDSIVEQLPKAGETVKTGQMIYVVTSKGGGTPSDVPPTVNSEQDDSAKIEEMISDKPKKSRTNTNSARKKADTTRDVADTNSNSNSASSDSSNSNRKENPAATPATAPANKQTPAAKPAEKPKPVEPQRLRPGTRQP
jgi:beta-lactam-binding protein with PASTA domain